MSEPKEVITVVLLGKASIGKSAVRKTLVDTDDNNFKWLEAALFEKNFREDDQSKWLIFKTPGLYTLEKSESLKEMCDDMSRLMKRVNEIKINGVTVFLLVFNIHNRYTQEAERIIQIYENIFGETEFWKHSIVVMTGGESFEGNLDKWVAEQTGEFEKLVRKCYNRIVLVSSKRNVELYESSTKKLFTQMRHLKMAMNKTYSFDNFMESEPARKKIVLEAELPKIREQFNREMRQIEREYYEHPRAVYSKLEIAKEYARLEVELRNKDNGTGLLQDLIAKLENKISEAKQSERQCCIF